MTQINMCIATDKCTISTKTSSLFHKLLEMLYSFKRENKNLNLRVADERTGGAEQILLCERVTFLLAGLFRGVSPEYVNHGLEVVLQCGRVYQRYCQKEYTFSKSLK